MTVYKTPFSEMFYFIGADLTKLTPISFCSKKYEMPPDSVLTVDSSGLSSTTCSLEIHRKKTLNSLYVEVHVETAGQTDQLSIGKKLISLKTKDINPIQLVFKNELILPIKLTVEERRKSVNVTMFMYGR